MTQLRRVAIFAAASASLVLIAGCAVDPGSAGDTTGGAGPVVVNEHAAAPGDVVGQGTVLQIGEAAPELCLGGVADSYPPQCTGPDIVGWDWTTVDGEESASDVTWGTYAVTGGWDGTAFTVKSAVTLALYDPLPFVDPLLDADNAGDTSDADLLAIQTKLNEDSPVTILTSGPQNGYLFAYVTYDDGSLQAWADEQYQPDRVVIRSALRDIEG